MSLLYYVPVSPNVSTYKESFSIVDMLSPCPCEGTSLALVYVEVFSAVLPHRYISINYGRLSVVMEGKSAMPMVSTDYGPMG
jgi:hypothetical protein